MTTTLVNPEVNKRRYPKTDRARIFLACPSYGADTPKLKVAVATASKRHHVEMAPGGLSDLAYGFNDLYCQALKRREDFTHFAMIHSDVWAEPCWLDKLVEEMDRVEADVLSVCLAMKDDPSVSSTGRMDLGGTDQRQSRVQKIKFSEIRTLPTTFGPHHLGCGVIGVNTGLWIQRFTEDWISPRGCNGHGFDGFEMRNRIEEDDDGAFPVTCGEDYGASIKWAALGLRVMATTCVKAVHYGMMGFPNWSE